MSEVRPPYEPNETAENSQRDIAPKSSTNPESNLPQRPNLVRRAIEAARLFMARRDLRVFAPHEDVVRMREIHQVEREGVAISAAQREREMEALRRELAIVRAEGDFKESTTREAIQRMEQYKTHAEVSEKTGLSTSRVFEEKLLRAGVRSAEGFTKGRLVVALFDLNGLGAANEANGHEGGDALLKATGEALSEGQRSSESPSHLQNNEYLVEAESHLHGDEFGVVLEDVRDGKITVDGQEQVVSGTKIWGMRKETAFKTKEAVLEDGTIVSQGISLGGGYVEIEPEELLGKSTEEIQKVIAEKKRQADEALFAAKFLSKQRNKELRSQNLPEAGFVFLSYKELQNLDAPTKAAIEQYRIEKAAEKKDK